MNNRKRSPGRGTQQKDAAMVPTMLLKPGNLEEIFKVCKNQLQGVVVCSLLLLPVCYILLYLSILTTGRVPINILNEKTLTYLTLPVCKMMIPSIGTYRQESNEQEFQFNSLCNMETYLLDNHAWYIKKYTCKWLYPISMYLLHVRAILSLVRRACC